jgi:hypothetical protein
MSDGRPSRLVDQMSISIGGFVGSDVPGSCWQLWDCAYGMADILHDLVSCVGVPTVITLPSLRRSQRLLRS